MITYNYNRYGSDFPFTPSKYIKTNLEVLLKMLDGEDLKQYKEYRKQKTQKPGLFSSILIGMTLAGSPESGSIGRCTGDRAQCGIT